MESEEIKDLFNRIKKDEISIDEGVEIFLRNYLIRI